MRRAALGLGLLVAGCTALLDFAEECTSDPDCAEERVCRQGLCVTPGPADGAARVDAALDAGATSIPEAGAPDAQPGDAVGPDAQTGAPSLPPGCEAHGVAADRLFEPDVVRLGLLLPTTGGLGSVGGSIRDGALLAMEEINQSGGLAGSRLAFVFCDTATNPAQAVQRARWMATAGQIPAVLGPATSAAVIEVFNEVVRPLGLLLVTPSGTSPAITTLEDEDLVWRTAPSDAFQGRAIAAYLEAKRFSRVAVVNRNDTYGNGLAEAVRARFCARAPCGGGEAYFNRSYAPDATGQALSAIMLAVRDFAPQTVVLVSFATDGAELLNLAGLAGLTRFVLSDGTRDSALLQSVSSAPVLEGVVGTASAPPAGDTYLAFVQRYEARYGARPGVYSAEAYDAAYLLAYAAGPLVDRAPLTGRAMAANLRRVSAGARVEAGPTDLGRGLRTLREDAAATIDYQGASGTLDFDENGEAANDIEAWRFDVPGQRIVSLGTLFTAAGAYSDLPGLPGPVDGAAPPPAEDARDAGVDGGE